MPKVIRNTIKRLLYYNFLVLNIFSTTELRHYETWWCVITWHQISSSYDGGQVLLTHSETNHRLDGCHVVQIWAFSLPVVELLCSIYMRKPLSISGYAARIPGISTSQYTATLFSNIKLILLAIVFIREIRRKLRKE